MTKKTGLFALFLIGLGFTGQAQMMHVREKSGTKTSFAIRDIQKLNFSGGNLIINSLNGNPASFAFADIRYVNFTDLPTGVIPSEKQKPELLMLFPNPVRDILTVNYKSSGNSLQIEVMTPDGKTVYRKMIHMQSGINQADVNVSSLPDGLYLCRIMGGKTVLVSKFLKYE
jgi:hypothetical protein